jgi:ABC-type multidrug transport system fused ATPase/permease subunit
VGSLSLSDLWQLLRHDWGQLAACVAFTAFSVACTVLVAPCLGAVVDIISRGTAATPRELALAVGRLGAMYIGSNVSLAVQVALALALGEGMAHRLRCRLFGALLSRDVLFFDSVKTGQMVAWLGQDIEVLQVRAKPGLSLPS